MAEKEDFERLKKKRAIERSSLTKLINKIDKLLTDEAVDMAVLEENLTMLIERNKNLKLLDSQIESKIDINLLDADLVDSDEYQEKYLMYIAKLKQIIKCKGLRVSMSEQTFKNDSEHSTEIINNEIVQKKVDNNSIKLPKIQITPFSGDPKYFKSFWDSFENTIDKNVMLSKIEKFIYLKSYLTGQASNVVSGFDLTNDNYDNCVTLLHQKYGRRDLILNSFVNKILSFPSVKYSSNVSALRKLYDDLDIAVRNLDSMKVQSESYGVLLIPIILQLLPEDLVLDFQRNRKSKDETDVNELLMFLKNEIECRESVAFLNDRKTNYNFNSRANYGLRTLPIKNVNKSLSKGTPSASALNAQMTTSICIFFSNPHDSFKCTMSPQDKVKILKNSNRCFKCFKFFHVSRNCRINKFPCVKCKGQTHHVSICLGGSRESNKTKINENKIADERSNDISNLASISNESKAVDVRNDEVISSVSQCNNNVNQPKKVYLQTCTAEIRSGSSSHMTRILLDNGSQRSFLSERVANSLNLKPVAYEVLSVYSFGMQRATERAYPVVEFEIFKRSTNFKTKVRTLVIPCISGVKVEPPDPKIVEFMNKNKMQMADSYLGDDDNLLNIELLIGSDLFWEFLLYEKLKINNRLSAIKTVLGWVISGSSFNKEHTLSQNIAVMKCITDSVDNFDLSRFWSLDAMGISNECEILSLKEREIINQFESNLVYKNNRYQTGLLWKSSPDELDSNFAVAKKRFDNLIVKLNKNRDIYDEYAKIIEDQENQGIVEECKDKSKFSGYFMPHRAVLRPDKETSRVRIVFDASSKESGSKSLNDLLLSGPNLNPNILDIMLKFRKHEVAFSADIEKAFLMIDIAEDDRKYLKFLWVDGESYEGYKVMNMKRLPFGVTTSPFILSATIKYHIKKYTNNYPDCVDMLNTSLYVDDLYWGADTVDNAYRLSSDAVEILKCASMNLRKFNSNSKELKQLWLENGVAVNDSLAHAKVLGLRWDTEKDKLSIEHNQLEQSSSNLPCTKRAVLRVAAQIYDPLGLISPFVIRMKILLQRIWKTGLDWDDPLPSDIESDFVKWMSEIIYLKHISLDRNYFKNCDQKREISIHIFTDASTKAYGAVAYFRYVNNANCVKTTFILSKSRVAPIKGLTLPRLELMAALVGARMYNYLFKLFHDICKIFYLWTDSKIVFFWIRSQNCFKPFVQNRISEIKTLTNPIDWQHCPGIFNPADKLTRGTTLPNLVNDDLWKFGPPWLKEDENKWPNGTALDHFENIDLEIRKNAISQNSCISNLQKNSFLNIGNYSSLLRVKRIVAWSLRFLYNLKHSDKRKGPLSTKEVNEAEDLLIREVQNEHFKEEIETLKRNEEIKSKSKIFCLRPYLDDKNILRICSRLSHSEMNPETVNPILIPKNSKLAELLIFEKHKKLLHSGINITLVQLRKKFWIPQCRQLVKRILGKCLVCKRHSAKPANQRTGELPKDRISQSPPFSVTGIDFTGPIYVKFKDEIMKSYIALFTCAVTRAVHLELISDLSTSKFILALRRFLSRRNSCKTIYSDNATTFKSAAKDIKYFFSIIKGEDFKNFISSEGITWKFIVELAPWWGGFYERLMRSLKEPLKKTLGTAQLSFEEMMTLLTEIENILNHRPLTHVSDDSSELEPLTPAHFLYSGLVNEYPYNFSELINVSPTRETLIKRKLYQTNLLKHVWMRWKDEYLLNLKQFHCSNQPNSKTNLKVSGVVLVQGDNKSKFLWNLGRIVKVFEGRDGLVRSCIVKTKKGEYRRPIQLLYPLEI